MTLRAVPRIEELTSNQLRALVASTHPQGNLSWFRNRAKAELSRREQRAKELAEINPHLSRLARV